MNANNPNYISNAHYIYYDNRTEVDKCLEGNSGLSDLLEKKITGETFTEEDANRISQCIEERKTTSATVVKWTVGILLLFGIALIAFVLLA